MESVSRNVILDLLPAYIAGEASEDSRALVEDFAENDPQIAEYIRIGKLEPDPISPKMVLQDDLEMKTFKRVRQSIRRKMLYVALVTASILLVPLFAMQFTDEVNWDLLDFIVMGILLFGAGLTYVLISRNSQTIAYRTAVGIAVAAGLLLIWMNLAVGIIGSEDNPANLMYIGVLAVGIIGAIIARFKPNGMSRALFATAFAQGLVAAIVLIAGLSSPANGTSAILIINGFFIALWIGSALLFRNTARV